MEKRHAGVRKKKKISDDVENNPGDVFIVTLRDHTRLKMLITHNRYVEHGYELCLCSINIHS